MSPPPDVAVPARIHVPSSGWVAQEIALRGHMLHVPVAGGTEPVDLRAVQAAFGRWVIFHVGQLRGSVLYLQWATGSIRMAGDGVLLPESQYTCQSAEQADLFIRPDDFEELLHQLESRGLSMRQGATAPAGYRDGRAQAGAEPLVILPRGGALGLRFVAFSFVGIATATLLGSTLGDKLLGRLLLGALAGFGLATVPIIVTIIRALRTLAWRARRLVLVGREMHLQAADGATTLATVRADEVTVRCYHRESRIKGGPGAGPAYSFFFAMMQVDIPGHSKPIFFGTDDPRLGWASTMDIERDWGAYGFTLSAPEYRAVAAVLGVAGDLELADL